MTTQPLGTVGVIGAGVMGAGIAQVLALTGYAVGCYDPDPGALQRATHAFDHGRFGLEAALARGKLTGDQAARARELLVFTGSVDEATEADVLIEAVPEDLALKIELFRDLDRRCPAHTVFASNSSGLPITALAAATDRPERVVGWHWASPAQIARMAEIVRTKATATETVEIICSMAVEVGCNPVVIEDDPMHWGYVVNRAFFAMLREAEQIVADGIAHPDQIDQLMTDCFRWPAGPFAVVRSSRSGWGWGDEPG